MRATLFLSLLGPLAFCASAQQKPQAISIHVREVRRVHEPHAGGVSVHITAVVETKTVVYSMRCEAFTKAASDNTRRNLICADLEAGHDYNAWKYSDAISLWKPEEYSGNDKRAVYSIISEKEK